MLTKVFKLIVFLFPFFLPSQAFWWRSSSTETPPPAPPIIKQIPLTYFRTYTYQQPLPNHQMQLPLLSSTDFITNYNALSNTPYFNPMMPPVVPPMRLPSTNEIHMETSRPVKSYSNVNLVRSFGPSPATTTTTTEPTTTSTTRTTTSTTTTEPTTSTTTTTEPSTTAAAESSSAAVPLKQTDSLVNVDSTFPAFNRKVFTNHFNINYNRPSYPYPEYSLYKPNSPNEEIQSPANVELVPCMCPVNIQNGGFSSGYQSGLPIAGNPSNSIFLAQGRTNGDAEASLDLPLANMDVDAGADGSNFVENLKMVKLEENEDTS